MILLTLFLATQSAWASWSSPVYERMCYFNQNTNDETQRDLFPCQISQFGQPVTVKDKDTSHWSVGTNIYFQNKTLVFHQYYSLLRKGNDFGYLTPESDITVKTTLNGKPAERYLQNHDFCYRSEEWNICIHKPNLFI